MLIKGRMPKTANAENTSKTAGQAAVVRMPNSLKIGKTLQGQVISIKGNEIELLLKGNTKISARVDQDMQVSLNQIMNFEVNKTGTSVILRPLFENLAKDPNAAKALQAANLPINSDNLNMVTSLMERGLPVDKNALQEMSRFMYSNPRATGNVLVEMKEFQIPITNENINQFVAYKGMNHYVSDSINSLTNELTDGMQTLVDGIQISTDGKQAEALLSSISKLNEMFIGKGTLQAHESAILQESVSISENTLEQTKVEINQLENRVDSKENSLTNISTNMLEDITLESEISKERSEYVTGKKINLNREEVAIRLYDEIASNKLSDNIMNELQLAKGDLGKTFQVLNSFLQNHKSTEDLTTIVKSDIFKQSVKMLLEDGVYLKAEEFSDKEAVKELFKSIKNQMNTMLEIGEQMGKSGEQVINQATNVQNNIEFMNQINQTFNYIQIPLKNGDNNGKGELFVYAKKKNKIEQGESVSALLHLDMRNLGAMDVRVQMTNEKVQTNFFLEDDKIMDFISTHLPELDAAIERRGYHVQSSASLNEIPKDSIEHLIEREESSGSILVSNQSFDARA
jgi:hypothetical protein